MVKGLAVCVFILLISSVSAHFRLRCPTPRSTSTGVKTAPCGSDGFGTGTKTTIAPGPLTLIWEESVNHIGAPFRIALSSANDNGYDTHVLLDHVPHDDLTTPVASDSGYKVYFLNVDIPDINCPSCALQVINPMTDKIPDGSTCTLPGTCTTNTNIYTSCADISITGAQSFDTYNWTYVPPKTWPYHDTPGIYTQESGKWSNGWLDGQLDGMYGACADQVPPGVNPNGSTTSTGSITASTTGAYYTTGTSNASVVAVGFAVFVCLISMLVF